MFEYKEFDCKSYEQAKEGHKYLWSYLAESGDSLKPSSVSMRLLNGCYACQFTMLLAKQYGIKNKFNLPVCSLCPVMWSSYDLNIGMLGNGDYICEEFFSPYFLWRNSFNDDSLKKYAAIIKDLPWVPEEELINKAESLRESQSLTIK